MCEDHQLFIGEASLVFRALRNSQAHGIRPAVRPEKLGVGRLFRSIGGLPSSSSFSPVWSSSAWAFGSLPAFPCPWPGCDRGRRHFQPAPAAALYLGRRDDRA